MKEKSKGNSEFSENDENRKTDDSPLVALAEIYTSRELLNLFVINKSKTRLKNIETNEVKDLEDEVGLLDLLNGGEESGIEEKFIDDLRQYFKFSKQIGFNPQTPYDYQFKVNENRLYNLSLFQKIQKNFKSTSEYNEF